MDSIIWWGQVIGKSLCGLVTTNGPVYSGWHLLWAGSPYTGSRSCHCRNLFMAGGSGCCSKPVSSFTASVGGEGSRLSSSLSLPAVQGTGPFPVLFVSPSPSLLRYYKRIASWELDAVCKATAYKLLPAPPAQCSWSLLQSNTPLWCSVVQELTPLRGYGRLRRLYGAFLHPCNMTLALSAWNWNFSLWCLVFGVS